MKLEDLTTTTAHSYAIGEEMCAALRTMRAHNDWARFVGTCNGNAWTWHNETAAALRAWLANN